MNNKVDLERIPVSSFASIPLILNASIKKKHFIYALLMVISLLAALIIDHLIV
jgi:hypothetical protein